MNSIFMTKGFLSLLLYQRFEHSSSKHKKICTKISFPQFLDMTPFMASQKSSNKNKSLSKSTLRISNSDNK